MLPVIPVVPSVDNLCELVLNYAVQSLGDMFLL